MKISDVTPTGSLVLLLLTGIMCYYLLNYFFFVGYVNGRKICKMFFNFHFQKLVRVLNFISFWLLAHFLKNWTLIWKYSVRFTSNKTSFCYGNKNKKEKPRKKKQNLTNLLIINRGSLYIFFSKSCCSALNLWVISHKVMKQLTNLIFSFLTNKQSKNQNGGC